MDNYRGWQLPFINRYCSHLSPDSHQLHGPGDTRQLSDAHSNSHDKVVLSCPIEWEQLSVTWSPRTYPHVSLRCASTQHAYITLQCCTLLTWAPLPSKNFTTSRWLFELEKYNAVVPVCKRDTQRVRQIHQPGLHTGFFSGGGGSHRCSFFVCICTAAMRTLVNKSHNNAVITNDVFLLVHVIILFVLYTYYIIIMEFWGGGIPVRPAFVCNPANPSTACTNACWSSPESYWSHISLADIPQHSSCISDPQTVMATQIANYTKCPTQPSTLVVIVSTPFCMAYEYVLYCIAKIIGRK